jgi:Ca2+-binding RTX toxin-like protein
VAVIVGTSGNDNLSGTAAADNIDGGDGDDMLWGKGGVDTVNGGAGDDIIRVADSDGGLDGDLLIGGSGVDTLVARNTVNLTGLDPGSGGFEKLQFEVSLFATVLNITVNASQLGTLFASDLQVTGGIGQSSTQSTSVSSNINILGVPGSTLDMSHWAFSTWDSGDHILFFGSAGVDTVTGSSQNDNLQGAGGDDTIHGGGGDDYIAGGSGADQVFGDAGDDTIAITQADWIAGDRVDGGAGVDTLATQGSIDFASLNSTLGGLEVVTMSWQGATPPASLNLTFNASQASGLGQAVRFKGSAIADNVADHVVVNGQAGVTADLSHWTFDQWASNDSVIFNGSAGADAVVVNTLGGHVQVTLGAGADSLELAPNADPQAKDQVVTVTDFQAGAGGDRLKLTNYLGGLFGYAPGADPFAAKYLRLIQNGADTLLQVDRDGPKGGEGFTTVVNLQNVNAQALTAANLDGLSPAVQSPTAVTGGPGLDIRTYTGLLRAYDVSSHDGLASVSRGPDGVLDNLGGYERLKFVDGYVSVGTTDTAARVYRIYEAALAREPDATGLANWVTALEKGGSLQTIADGFLNSPEFIGRFGAGDNATFVNLLYQNVLGRTADSAGLTAWTNLLAAGHSRSEILTGFSESPEFIAGTAPAVQHGLWVGDADAARIARLYDTMFDRLPDASGEVAWTAALKNGASLQSIADSFFASAEFQNKYGGIGNPQFVELLYQNVLGRLADQGRNSWVDFINAGHSRAEVAVGFSESPEHLALTAPQIDHGVWFG